MKSTLLAGLSALALMSVPALAQSSPDAGVPQSGVTSGQTGMTGQSALPDTSASSGLSDQTAATAESGRDMLGKSVKSQDGQDIGKIEDILVKDGSPSTAVIRLEQQDKQVTVAVDSLTQSGEDFTLSMPQDQVATLPEFDAPAEGETSLQQQAGTPDAGGAATDSPAGASPGTGAGEGAGTGQPR